MTPEQLRDERRAEHILADEGVFAGHGGLRGLYESREFWQTQPYGTRLYYGGGGQQYLHHSVLGAAIDALDKMAELKRAHADALEEIERLKGLLAAAAKELPHCSGPVHERIAVYRREHAKQIEQAERRAERLKWHAEAMATKYEAIRSSSVSRIDHAEAELYEAVEAYRAEFKEEK